MGMSPRSPVLQMATNTQQAGLSATGWKPSGGRITLFTAGPAPPLLSALDLYRKVWREDPNSFQKQKNPLSPSFAQGEYEGMAVNCVSAPTRIDLGLAPPLPQPDQGLIGADDSLPLIEDPAQFQAELLRIIEIASEFSPSIRRVALGVQFLSVKPSVVEANDTITKTIPVNYGVTITTEGDFVFQVNRRYLSRAVPDIEMNCITKWSVERFEVVSFAVTRDAQSTSAPTNSYLAASVTLDINNVPTDATLPRGQQLSLLREALDKAVGIQHENGLNVEGLENAKLHP